MRAVASIQKAWSRGGRLTEHARLLADCAGRAPARQVGVVCVRVCGGVGGALGQATFNKGHPALAARFVLAAGHPASTVRACSLAPLHAAELSSGASAASNLPGAPAHDAAVAAGLLS